MVSSSTKPNPTESALRTARKVLRIEAEAIAAVERRLDERFDRAVQLLLGCGGRVVVSGMGKSGLVARKIAATLNSTGTPALFMHPAEALHGDLGMLVRGDVVVALSYSGETREIVDLLGPIKRLGICLLTLTGQPGSTIGRAASVCLDVGIDQEACSLGLAPTASTTAALAMGDALAIAVAERRGFTEQDFAGLHPGGKLGKRLAPIAKLMHVGGELPIVRPETAFHDVVYEMSRKGFGVTSVLDDAGRVIGLVSDGDLRRLLEQRGRDAIDLRAREFMTADPVTIGPDELAPAALNLLEAKRITALLVTDAERHLVGLIHLHDLWTTELI